MLAPLGRARESPTVGSPRTLDPLYCPVPNRAGAVDVIRLEFEISESEYREASRAGSKKSRDWYRPLTAAGTIQAAAGFALLIGADRHSWLAPVLLIAGGLFVATYPWLRYKPAVAAGWKTYAQRAGPVVWEFSRECIRYETALSTIRYSWYAFDRLAETGRLFLLYSQDNPMLIPKRAFADAAQQAEFRNLAAELLHRPAPAFPVQPVT